ncbi:MAG: hypothetical protein ABIG96_01190 [Candidatus Micrarchaeota archaeon]
MPEKEPKPFEKDIKQIVEKEPKPAEKEKAEAADKAGASLSLHIPEFIRPNPLRMWLLGILSVFAVISFLFLLSIILTGRHVGPSVLLFGKDFFFISVVFFMLGGFFYNLYLPFLQFGSYSSLLVMTGAFIAEIAYLYFLACLLSSIYERRQWTFGVIALLVLLIAFIMTPPKSPYSEIFPKAECLYPVVRAAACYNSDGSWNSGASNIDAVKYQLPEKCLMYGGALDGTPWKSDETHFNCGPPPA